MTGDAQTLIPSCLIYIAAHGVDQRLQRKARCAAQSVHLPTEHFRGGNTLCEAVDIIQRLITEDIG